MRQRIEPLAERDECEALRFVPVGSVRGPRVPPRREHRADAALGVGNVEGQTHPHGLEQHRLQSAREGRQEALELTRLEPRLVGDLQRRRRGDIREGVGRPVPLQARHRAFGTLLVSQPDQRPDHLVFGRSQCWIAGHRFLKQHLRRIEREAGQRAAVKHLGAVQQQDIGVLREGVEHLVIDRVPLAPRGSELRLHQEPVPSRQPIAMTSQQ